MKKVLVISDHFYPQRNIGALRPTKVAGQLLLRGYEVDVFTKYQISKEMVQEKCLCNRLYGYMQYQSNEKTTVAEPQKGTFDRLKPLRDLYYNLMGIKPAIKSVRGLLESLSQNKEFGEKRYDVVWSSFGPLESLVCALQYKKMHPETKWICDFRDPMVTRYCHPLMRPFYAYVQKKACKKADTIVAVSNGYLERICHGKFREKAYMLPNGYDLEDMAYLKGEASQTGALTLTYVGALYGGDRDLSPLFQTIRELVDENSIQEDAVCVAYAGKEFDVLKRQAEAYGLKGILQDNGMLSREDCLKLQARADMLLISTWNDKDEYGVFPGKMLEYMLIGKPIVSLTCGDMPNGEITQVIREGNFGVAYEAACHKTDFAELKGFIKLGYQQKKEQGVLSFTPNQTVLDRYNYHNIITRLEVLMNATAKPCK